MAVLPKVRSALCAASQLSGEGPTDVVDDDDDDDRSPPHPPRHLRPWGWGQMVQHQVANILPADTPPPSPVC